VRNKITTHLLYNSWSTNLLHRFSSGNTHGFLSESMWRVSGEGSPFTGNHQSRRSLSAGVVFFLEPNLSAGTRPPNPSILHNYRHRPRSQPAKQFSVRFVLATGSHPMLLRKLCDKWNGKGRSRGLYIWL